MKKLTKEDILSFPMTSFGRSIGKQLASQVVQELLGYKQLEEQIGCPLEVRVKVTCDTKIYDDSGMEYNVDYVYKDNFVCHNGACDDYGCDYEFTFSWYEYKREWFLKKDKSE